LFIFVLIQRGAHKNEPKKSRKFKASTHIGLRTLAEFSGQRV